MPRREFLLLAMAGALGLLPRSAAANGFTGAGSTFAQPILNRWGRAYASREGEGGATVQEDSALDYEPVGSTAGLMRVVQRSVEFGVTDVPLPPAELDKQALAQFPIVSGGVAIVANLPGLAGGALRLNGDALARIFLGQVTRWGDPAIRALNPGLTLPDQPIAVRRRQDGSGTTWHFAGYLGASNAEWRSRLGVDTTMNWPVGTGAKGNRELAEAVRATPGAIGYVEASQAARLGLPIALLGNAAGRFLGPDPAALAAALTNAPWDAARHFYAPPASPADPAAYPIVATAYALFPREPRSTARTRMALEFFRTALFELPGEATRLGYLPLPAAVAERVAAYWHTTIRGAR